MEERNVEEVKLKELEKVIMDCVTKKISLEDLYNYKSDFDEEFWEVEGFCVVMRTDVFKLLKEKEDLAILILIFNGTHSMSSDKVRHSLVNLVDSHRKLLLKTSMQNDSKVHWNMCRLLEEMIHSGHEIDENCEEIFEYIVTVVEVCEDEWTVWLTVDVFSEYPMIKVKHWLMQRLDFLMAQLDAKVVEWKEHRNMVELIWKMLRYVEREDNEKYYSYSNVLDLQLSDQILNYMMLLLDCDKYDSAKIKVIANLELMCVMDKVDQDDEDKLRNKLNVVAEKFESAALLPNQQFNSIEHQVGWCARWCLDNVWDEDGHIDQLPPVKLSSDRFETRNDSSSLPTVRSSLGVTSGVYYYEVLLITSGCFRIGWNTRDATFDTWKDYFEVGDDEHSIAFDVYYGRIVHNNIEHQIDNLPAHQTPNVVGCLIDTVNRQFVFYLNGHKIDCQVEAHFSTSPYYATVSLDTSQQCCFNLGQKPFKYPPKDVQFVNFSQATNGDVTKFQLVDTEHNAVKNWFNHPVIDNQVDLLYRDPQQLEHDEFLQQVEHLIVNNQTDKMDLSQVKCNRFIQSIIEAMQTKLNDDQCIREILTNHLSLHKDQLHIFSSKMFELIYPYTQLQFNPENNAKSHNLGIILVAVLNLFPNIPPLIYQTSLNFLLSTKLIGTETLKRNAQLVTSALAGFDEYRFNERNKQNLLKNEAFSTTLKCIDKYGQIDSISRLYEQNCDSQLLQAGICAKWLYDQVISGVRENKVRGATLNPTDRSTLLKLSSDRLAARSDCHWQSVRSFDHDKPTYVHSDIYYFEVILLTDGPMRIGWATKRSQLNESKIGKDRFSISFDGFTRAVRHQGEVYQQPDIEPWKVGDVIGCLIDKINRKFAFSLNGQELSLPSNPHFSPLPYHAVVSLSSHQQVYCNFGQAPFKYDPQHLDYWDFDLALSYRENQIFKTEINMRNAKVTNAIISVDSTVTTGNISIKRSIHNLQTVAASNFYPSKKSKMNPTSQSHSLQIDSNNSMPSSQESSHAKCRLCNESFSTKLVRFACCSNLILCLDCVKVRSLCPKCSKQPSDLRTSSTCSSLPVFQVFECLLCEERNQTRNLRFLCCNSISLCLDCIKPIIECPKCSKPHAKSAND